MIDIVEFLKQSILVGFEILLIAGIFSLVIIICDATRRILKSKAWGDVE